MKTPVIFDLEKYKKNPKIFPAKQNIRPGVKSFYFQNEPYKGKETRVFAWLGIPFFKKKGTSCPAMVLLHGGGGTACDEWVRLWNGRGYAAIAIDLCGHIPEMPIPIMRNVLHKRHKYSGPEGWDASFFQMNNKIQDHWQYHAITAVLRAHTILANTKNVDANKIGITGISWGGYLTSLIMGIDSRYGAAIPVYGCGFITENSIWKTDNYGNASKKDIGKWDNLWDPKYYISNTNMPTLWVTGTNDFAYPMDSFKKTYMLTNNYTISIGVEMKHSHPDGWNPNEIHHFTDSIFKNEAPLPKYIKSNIKNNIIYTIFESIRPLMKADICFTRALGMWQDRKWNIIPETKIINKENILYYISCKLPVGITSAFVNVYDDRGVFVSSPYIEI